MGGGRASALMDCALTCGCQKVDFFEYGRVMRRGMRLEPLMNEQSSVLRNVEDCGGYGLKTVKKGQNGRKWDF